MGDTVDFAQKLHTTRPLLFAKCSRIRPGRSNHAVVEAAVHRLGEVPAEVVKASVLGLDADTGTERTGR